MEQNSLLYDVRMVRQQQHMRRSPIKRNRYTRRDDRIKIVMETYTNKNMIEYSTTFEVQW